MIYADSSVLVSLYMLDANTARALPLVRSLIQPLAFSALHQLEVRNAFSLAVFRRHHSQVQADHAIQHFENDQKAGVLVASVVDWHAALNRAAFIATTVTPKVGSQSIDILHVACAEQLNAREFLTFDQRQHELAESVGLRVRP